MKLAEKRKIKVMLADPKDISRNLLKAALPMDLYTIHEARDNDLLLSLIESGNYVDIICVDATFDPDFKLLEAIKTKAPKVGVIVVSADASRSTVLKAIENGADDFIIKPFTPVRIQNAINKCFVSRKRQPIKKPEQVVSQVAGAVNADAVLEPITDTEAA